MAIITVVLRCLPHLAEDYIFYALQILRFTSASVGAAYDVACKVQSVSRGMQPDSRKYRVTDDYCVLKLLHVTPYTPVPVANSSRARGVWSRSPWRFRSVANVAAIFDVRSMRRCCGGGTSGIKSHFILFFFSNAVVSGFIHSTNLQFPSQ